MSARTPRRRPMDPASKTASHTQRIILRPNIAEKDLPPLPDIRDDNLRLQVFTHRSFYARQTHQFEDPPDDPCLDNEMLEYLGDSVLGLVVAELLLATFPNLRVGSNTKIRGMVVGNTNLASISLRYHLLERLRMNPAQLVALMASHKIQADVFEAYIGGLYLDQGLEAVRAWLRVLLHPYLLEAYRMVREEYGLPPLGGEAPAKTASALTQLSTNTPRALPPPGQYSTTGNVGHLALFNQCLHKESKSPEWVYTDSVGKGSPTTPVWVVQAMVDGNCIGRGRGNTKKAAKNEAAKEGLTKLGVDVASV